MRGAGGYDHVSSVTDSAALEEDQQSRHDRAPSSVLYGRGEEQQTLLQTYEQVKETGCSQVVSVHGGSGFGKTALVVETLREHLIESHGYFCSGKFFQESEMQEPYSAFTTAFSDLVDLVVQSKGFNRKRLVQIREDLGSNRHLLRGTINMAPFLSKEDQTLGSESKMSRTLGSESDLIKSEINSEENVSTFARFKIACKAFLRAMTASKNDDPHTLVLFIDDIQWMDEGSKKLVDMFVDDQDIRNVLFVFAYRDDETTPALRPGQAMIDIKLNNLRPSDVDMMVSAHFVGPVSGNVSELSNLVFQRTNGNPFFVQVLLEVIQTENMVVLDKAGAWMLDVDKIRKTIMISDDAAELLSQRIHGLKSDVRSVLVTASMLGYSFNEAILDAVLKALVGAVREDAAAAALSERLHSRLETAVKAGFIEKTSEGYQFTHDRLQAAFQELSVKSAQERLHLIIGEVYLAQEGDGSAIYTAAVHLHSAPDFLHNDEQRVKLARIDLRAARYCQQVSAFDKAAYLLRCGIDLLDEERKWSHELFYLTFEMTKALAKMELLVGNFEACREATHEATLRANSNERLASIVLIEIECQTAQNEIEVSVKNAILSLAELGVKIPRKVSMRHLVFKFLRVNMLMTSKTDEEILEMPMAHSGSYAVAVRLLMHICLYSLLMDDQPTGIYAALLAMDVTLKHGRSTYSTTALAIFAVAVRITTGNVDRAYGLGKLALKLLESNKSREADCSTMGVVYTDLLHSKQPLCDLRDPLFESATRSFERGDVILGTVYISNSFAMAAVMGSNLEDLEASAEEQFDRIKNLGQSDLLIWMLPTMQFLANLRGDNTYWHDLCSMTGEFMEYEGYLKEAKRANNMVMVVCVMMMKAILNCMMGHFDVAAALFDDMSASAVGKAVCYYSFPHAIWCWGAGCSNYEQYMASGNRTNWKKARKMKRTLQRSIATGNPNSALFLRHLELKEAIVTWKIKRSRKQEHDDTLLNRFAIDLEFFTHQKPPFVEASANIDAGFVAARMGRHSESEGYFSQAVRSSKDDWGAIAAARWTTEQMVKANPTTQQLRIVGGVVEFGGSQVSK